MAQTTTLYSNGPYNGTADAWTINFGFSVSDSFTLSNVPRGMQCRRPPSRVLGCSSTDLLTTVDMQLGGTSFSGAVNTLTGVTNTFLGTNQYRLFPVPG